MNSAAAAMSGSQYALNQGYGAPLLVSLPPYNMFANVTFSMPQQF